MGGLYTGIRPVHISPTSRMVQEYSGMMVQPHKAIVGANAFAHESGIHQDGMLKNRETYEVRWVARRSTFCHLVLCVIGPPGYSSRHSQIMSPETIGLVRKDEAGIVLGKHSGRHALSTALHGLGYDIRDEQMDGVFRRFKELADRKKSGITDEDLEALMGDQVRYGVALGGVTGGGVVWGGGGVVSGVKSRAALRTGERYCGGLAWGGGLRWLGQNTAQECTDPTTRG